MGEGDFGGGGEGCQGVPPAKINDFVLTTSSPLYDHAAITRVWHISGASQPTAKYLSLHVQNMCICCVLCMGTF